MCIRPCIRTPTTWRDLPLLRAGLALSAVVPIAPASDTLSIAVMEIVDNAIMLAVPGAMDAGLDNVLFWAPCRSRW